ncbi:hypothetical protein [Streptomyces sp. SID161]|uniref:hypothetical protein n=1 Tax=Streptomyces sp. SID161 TaxID=2690251 RepID=UPI00136B61B1|nr:hypothetical protein [Streptomyces sp. SID161]MYW43050.1 hypothetical protein [Streptomyces sp. SID161]
MIKRLAVTKAVAAMLADASQMPVGRGQKPKADPPYYLLYSVDTDLSGAPFTDLNEDASLVYQVTAVSGPSTSTASSAGYLDQAEWMADKAREAFLSRDPRTGDWVYPLTVPGYRVICRELETEPGGTSDPTDGIISYVQRFRLDWTPA